MIRFIFLAILLLAPGTLRAESLIQTSAKQAAVIDYDTGAVLLDVNAHERMPTSSMSKTMTTYMVFDALKQGKLQLSDTFKVSEKAWKKGGSKMFVEVNKQVEIEDLLLGVIVQSGNDATIVLAEGVAGSEDEFSHLMTQKAHEIGMKNSNFVNASGWPDPNHYSTAYDLAIMGAALIRDFPDYYPYYAEQEFSYNNIKQTNRNPLLYRNIGADGIKTGHTEAGGYGLIGSGEFAGRRVIMVVNGLADEKARAQESAKLLEWGLKRFENHQLFTAGSAVESANVIMGQAETVGAVLDEDLTVTIPKVAMKEFKVNANFKEPLVAPIKKGDQVGTLVVDIPYLDKVERPLYAAEDVPSLGFFAMTVEKAKIFVSGGAGSP